MRNFKVLESFRFVGALIIATGHLFHWTRNYNKFIFI